MDINKNSYTFGFAAIMVILVAALLSFAAMQLKPLQDRNIELETKQNILRSVGINVERNDAEIPYEENIKQAIVLNIDGEEIEGVVAEDIDLAVELKKDPKDQRYPIYISEKEGNKRYIIPLRGKGLWGPIWGYIALEDDLNTVYGAVFDHKSETPGLGAEINRPLFQDPFRGKVIYNENGEFVSIRVAKGTLYEKDMHAVDGIAGGTITSTYGVTNMLKERLEKYLPYFRKHRPEAEVTEIMEFMDQEERSDSAEDYVESFIN